MDVRRMEKEDILAYTELFNLAEAHDPEFIRKTIQDMEKIIFRKPTDTLDGYFVAYKSDTMIAGGNGWFSPDQAKDGRGSFTLHVLPNHVGSGAEQEVCDGIVRYMKKIGAKKMGTRANDTNTSKVQMLERLGFVKTAYQRHHMERSPHSIPEPVLPRGYKLRNARMPEEMEQLLETINAAYSTREGFGVQTLEDISKFPYLTDPEFLPGLFVVEKIEDGKIVGMLGSQIEHVYNREHGRKRGSSYSLMVIPSERGKGIGRALMQSSLHWIASKGMDVAYLGVNHQNPDALHLYKSLGYELVGVWQGYEKEL